MSTILNFNSFNENKKLLNDIIPDIKDILLDLKDFGIEYKIRIDEYARSFPKNRGSRKISWKQIFFDHEELDCIVISFVGNNIDVDNIIPTIKRLKNYVEGYNLNIDVQKDDIDTNDPEKDSYSIDQFITDRLPGRSFTGLDLNSENLTLLIY